MGFHSRILVCGGRDYADWMHFRDVMEEIAQEKFDRTEPDVDGNFLYTVTIISGAARGADQMAIDWAVINWCRFEEYPADWNQHGRRAGPIRNQKMLDEGKPDLVIAFPGGIGTHDMVRRAKKAGIEVLKIRDRGVETP